ncbi:MAG: hypothetical protein ACLU0O_02340 [Collinsella sp.]
MSTTARASSTWRRDFILPWRIAGRSRTASRYRVRQRIPRAGRHAC